MVMVKIDVRGIAEVRSKIAALSADMRDKVLASALNKTAAKAKAEMSRRIREEFAIKASDVNPQLSIRKASAKGNTLEAVLQAFPKRRGHRSRNVMMFGARPVKGTKTKRVRVQVAPGQWRMMDVPIGGGVSVLISKQKGRKTIKGAFIANLGRTVFIRTGNGRQIKAVETIDVPSMFNTRRINEAVVSKAKADLAIELDRAIRFHLSRVR
jgi:hypothetical protein